MSDITVEVTGEPSITVDVQAVGAQGPAGPGADPADIQDQIEAYAAPISHAHAQSDVTGLEATLAGKADGSHTHAQSDVTGLAAALAGKSDTGHTHTSADISDFDDAVQAIVDASPGGGAAWGGITGTLEDQTDLATVLDGKSDDGHTHAQADVTGLTAALAGKADSAHTHTASQISDFNTAADARVTAGITGKLDITDAPELIRDTIAVALVAGTNVTITPNDGADTITIDATGGGGGSAQEVRHDSDATYSYMGSATAGTAEGSSGWTVTRITLSSPPVIEDGTGTWTGRAAITYS
ncbi:hypothetical protein [Microbacterium sp. NPDC055455]